MFLLQAVGCPGFISAGAEKKIRGGRKKIKWVRTGRRGRQKEKEGETSDNRE